jgi:Zn-dependent protease
MFGIHVRVHPLFWLISVIFGWNLIHEGLQYLLLWVVCVFVSILLHELGHVWMGRFFGSDGHIVLYSMGGLAVGSSNLRNRWQRIAVYLAGPGIQLVLYGLLELILHRLSPRDLIGRRALLYFLGFMIDINLYWPILNLFPIWPLDGGRICRDFMGWLVPRSATRTALTISVATAGLLALGGLVSRFGSESLPIVDAIPFIDRLSDGYTIFLFAMLAISSGQLLAIERQRPPWEREDYD